MASKTKRHEARKKRQRRAAPGVPTFDPHAEVIVDTWASLAKLMVRIGATDDPEAAAGAALNDAVAEFAAKVQRFDPIRLIEVARLASLPMAPIGAVAPIVPDASASRLELLALVALAAQQEVVTGVASQKAAVGDQEMSHFVSEAQSELDGLLHLAQLRSFASTDPTDKLALVSLLIQGARYGCGTRPTRKWSKQLTARSSTGIRTSGPLSRLSSGSTQPMPWPFSTRATICKRSP
ncbi:hypothetical protein [Streptomyces scabiei]|uniref:hypothetical protein n=1 Tax=Streptomyces scabiei TaxID=1930 RepID=UPI001FF6BCBE|nr:MULTISPECIES: hypothetical protein [unclassified Streptomyces]